MYRNYTIKDYLRVVDECYERIKGILSSRQHELEGRRDAINDRYPFEDLLLQQAAVDDEEDMIRMLLEYLDFCKVQMKKTTVQQLRRQ